MFTYRIESKRLEGTVTNMKSNLNHGSLVSAFIFFQLSSRGAGLGTAVADYSADQIDDSGIRHMSLESYRIDTSDLYCEVNG